LRPKQNPVHRKQLCYRTRGRFGKMAKLLWACALGLAPAFASEEDAACLLQARESKTLAPELIDEKEEGYSKGFCKHGFQRARIDFGSFDHGEVLKKDSLGEGIKFEAASRKQTSKCGPAMILDPSKPNKDPDLATSNKKLLIWSRDGNSNVVDDCPDRPGPEFTFTFPQPTDIVNVKLWDQDEPTSKIKLVIPGPNNDKELSVPVTKDGRGVTLKVKERGVKKLIVKLAGSGGLVNIKACLPPPTVYGDPHIHTLDGGKFDLYESGTFSVFHYSGRKTEIPSKGAKADTKSGDVDWQLFANYGGPGWTAQGLLLVDRSMGGFRQALELVAEDCQWRSRTGESDWSEVNQNSSLSLLDAGDFVTGFEYFNEKHVALRMNSKDGVQDVFTVNTICTHDGINMRISMPDTTEGRFVTGQIQNGNAEKKEKFAVKELWAELGGSDLADSFLQKTAEQKYTLLTSCTPSQRRNAEKKCAQHLGSDADEDFFDDCVFDVCRGGEQFAVAAAEMLALGTD